MCTFAWPCSCLCNIYLKRNRLRFVTQQLHGKHIGHLGLLQTLKCCLTVVPNQTLLKIQLTTSAAAARATKKNKKNSTQEASSPKRSSQQRSWQNKNQTEKHRGSESNHPDRYIQCLKIMSINRAYSQLGANNSVRLRVCVCPSGWSQTCYGKGSASGGSQVCSWMIVLSRKWCHRFVLVPSDVGSGLERDSGAAGCLPAHLLQSV